MSYLPRCLLLVWVGLVPVRLAIGAQEPWSTQGAGAQEGGSQTELQWHKDFMRAMRVATEQGKMLFIFFHNTGENKARDAFESKSLRNPGVVKGLSNYTLARVPVDATITIDGQEQLLLGQPAFTQMLGRQGVAIIDLQNREAKHYGYVVTAFPFDPGGYASSKVTATMLALPPGTLTQRTLIFAVRTHPESPASTNGKLSPTLAEQAEKHAAYQARIQRQGHHRWEIRFQQILRLLAPISTAKEVCAESWRGETLADAAVECVHSWRRSSGHWGAVRGFHSRYGYDMKRGDNGIWYATGLFAD